MMMIDAPVYTHDDALPAGPGGLLQVAHLCKHFPKGVYRPQQPVCGLGGIIGTALQPANIKSTAVHHWPVSTQE